MTGLDVEAVLREHEWFTPRGYAWPCCNCGEEFTGGEDAAYAHVAAVLRVEIESALGDVLREAADDLEGRLGTDGAPRNLYEFRQWLRRRANQLDPYRPTLAATKGD